MNVIAESSSTRTEWALVEGNQVIEHAFTTGLNPFFQTRREISHCLRLELPEVFFKKRWNHVYFYGAGCATQEKCKVMASSLVAQFRSPVTVESDLLGAARGLLVHNRGLACILGTGSNSCLYNGSEIVKNVSPLGFILGDEGSGAYIGKKLIADILRGIAPSKLTLQFYEYFNVSPNILMDDVYSNQLPQRTLAKYAQFLAHHLDDAYAYQLVYNAFMAFFNRNITAYAYNEQPLCFVGSICTLFENVLRQAAKDFGIEIEKISRYSMPGLVEYHATDNG